MNQRLMRPTAALFPLVIMLATLLSPRDPYTSGFNDLPVMLIFGYYMIQFFTLWTVDTFRNRAAREPGVRRVDQLFGGALVVVLLGSVLYNVRFSNGSVDYMAVALACITIEHLFEERMFALGRRVDGVVLSIIANLLLFAGLMMDTLQPGYWKYDLCFYTMCASALGMLIAIITSYAIEPPRGFSLIPECLVGTPKAFVQTAIYPLINDYVIFICLISVYGDLPEDWNLGSAEFMYGLAVWRLSRTVCRRTQDESRPLNLLLCASVALPLLLKAALGVDAVADVYFFPFALSAMVAFICAAIVFCAPSWRLYLGMALLIAAVAVNLITPFPIMWNRIAIAVLSAAAVVINLHRAFLKKAKRPVYDFGE